MKTLTLFAVLLLPALALAQAPQVGEVQYTADGRALDAHGQEITPASLPDRDRHGKQLWKSHAEKEAFFFLFVHRRQQYAPPPVTPPPVIVQPPQQQLAPQQVSDPAVLQAIAELRANQQRMLELLVRLDARGSLPVPQAPPVVVVPQPVPQTPAIPVPVPQPVPVPVPAPGGGQQINIHNNPQGGVPLTPAPPYSVPLSPAPPYQVPLSPTPPYTVPLSPQAPYTVPLAPAPPYTPPLSPQAPFSVPLTPTPPGVTPLSPMPRAQSPGPPQGYQAFSGNAYATIKVTEPITRAVWPVTKGR